MIKYTLILFLILSFSCNTSKDMDKNNNDNKVQLEASDSNDTSDSSNNIKKVDKSNIKTINAPIVTKNFYSKKGEMTDIKEYYVQQSVQDYFIKFCESVVTSKELKEALDQQEGLIKTLTLKVEIRDGLWDQCEEEGIQSRMGSYIVIYEIIE